MEVEAPPAVAAEFLTQPQTGRMMVHLVNFEPDRVVKGIRVSLRRSRCGEFRAARLLTPDRVKQGELALAADDDGVSVEVPRLELYGMVVLEGETR